MLSHLHDNPEYAYEYFCQHKDKRDSFISACQKVFNVQQGPGSITFEWNVSGETGTATTRWEMLESETASTVAPGPKKRRKTAELPAEQNPFLYSSITFDGSQTGLADLARKAQLIGSQETILALKVFLVNLRRDSNDEARFEQQVRELCFLSGVSSTPLSTKLRHLKETIEFHEMKGTLSKCLQRFYLADLAGAYLKEQANSIAKSASATKFVRGIVPYFVDTLFPETANFALAYATSTEGDIRKKAVKKFMNWKSIGGLWLQFSLRFGAGVLLILPDNLTDARLVPFTLAHNSAV